MSYPIKNKPLKENNTFAVDNSKEKAKKKLFLQEIKGRGEITEQELLLVKRRLNDGTYTSQEVYEIIGEDGLKLTQEQQTKGKSWLMNKWKSPTGKVRENSPYGYREESILENFQEIRLKDFYNAGHSDFKNYVPLYEVSGNNTTMEYYVQGGEPKIIG